MISLLDLYKILNTICFCSFFLADKDKEIYNLSDCELENELKDFDDFRMDDLDGSNNMDENLVYGEDLPLDDNIHHINDDLGF